MSYANGQQVIGNYALQPPFSEFFFNTTTNNNMLHYTTNPDYARQIQQIQGIILPSYGYNHFLDPRATNSSDHFMIKDAVLAHQIPPHDDHEYVSRSLVLDKSKGEIVNAPRRTLIKETREEEKALLASKIHSEAERRRRERINCHLATLRTILSSSCKVDKASLLGEVVDQLKQLKRKVSEVYEDGNVMPTESNELNVEREYDQSSLTSKGRVTTLRVSLCCEDHEDLMSGLKQTFDAFELRTLKAEISTLGGRIKNVFVVAPKSWDMEEDGGLQDVELMIKQVKHALKLVMERPGEQGELIQGKSRKSVRVL